MASRDLEAKVVVLGASGVGKTSLLTRYIHNKFLPPDETKPTIGATFLTKRLVSPDTDPPTTIRLQIWDTAGQERFRSISKLYYRGANAALLCYDITSEPTFAEMGTWLEELKRNCGDDCIIHVVGTKADVVADDPRSRAVPFERCIQYIAEQLHGAALQAMMESAASAPRKSSGATSGASAAQADVRNSGFWDIDPAWDSCHEISAKDGEGIEEVFRVLTRKLVEQRDQKDLQRRMQADGVQTAGAIEDRRSGYFEGVDKKGSFRIGIGDRRMSWLGFPSVRGGPSNNGGVGERRKDGRCC